MTSTATATMDATEAAPSQSPEAVQTPITAPSAAPRTASQRAISQLLDPVTRSTPMPTFTFSPFLQREHAHPRPIGAYKATSSLICKHWLRGLCKKGTHCEFLHEYNLRGMPQCQEWNRYNACRNGTDCLFLHLAQQPPACPHYERGFCPLGPACANTHTPHPLKRICPYYMAGFCPDGRECTRGAHPLWKEKEDLPKLEVRRILTEEEKEREKELAIEKMEKETGLAEEREAAGGDRGKLGMRGRVRRGGWQGRKRGF